MVNLTKITKPTKESNIKRGWHLIDANNKIVGRLASEIAVLLIGKNKVNFVPNLDMGDNVVIVNCEKVVLSGKKEDTKTYTRYSGFPGGLKKKSFQELKENKPEEIIKRAVSGMLPKNKLRDRRLTRLFIFKGENHNFKDKFNK